MRLSSVCLVTALASTGALAEPQLAPGDIIDFGTADSCSAITFVPNVIEELARADGSCDADARRIRAQVRPIVGAGWAGLQSAQATSYLRNDFHVTASPETAGHRIAGWVTYDVEFEGLIVFIGLLSTPTVELAMTLTDLTENKVIKGELIWSRDGEGFGVSIPYVPIDFNFGGGIDRHAVTSTFTALLTRGHSYRLELKLACTVFSDGGLDVGSECDYMDRFLGGDGGGAGWNQLSVKAGLDEREVLDKLERLTNHTHGYLTGAGIGQNNTQAETTPPVPSEEEPASPPPASRKLKPPQR